MIVVIDNYDSFTYNLIQILQKNKLPVRVYENDKVTLEELKKNEDQITAFLLSPGPGSPKDSGVCFELINYFFAKKPILGVCLGHQVLAEFFGAKVMRAERVMHGKISEIYHDGENIYSKIPNPFSATRYHSLIVDRLSLPEALLATSWTQQNELMGFRHRFLPIEGVQFHPESIMCSEGETLIMNFFRAI